MTQKIFSGVISAAFCVLAGCNNESAVPKASPSPTPSVPSVAPPTGVDGGVVPIPGAPHDPLPPAATPLPVK